MRIGTVLAPVLALAVLAPIAAAHAGQTIQASANYSVTVLVAADNDPAMSAQEQKIKRSLYERAAVECRDLIATIALTCSITNISVSTQINRNYGQPPQVYANASVAMQVTLK
jgi:hypothetical protein